MIATQWMNWISQKNRWWVALFLGFTYALALAPFDGDFAKIFVFLPLISFVIFIPVLSFSLIANTRKALWYCYLYGVSASFVQFYWIALDKAEGVWHLIIVGLVLASFFFGSIFFVIGALGRLIFKRFSYGALLLIPSVVVLLDFLRTQSDLAFPWAFIGYSLLSLTPLAQLASLGGVYLLSFLIVCGNVIVFGIIFLPQNRKFYVRSGLAFVMLLLLAAGYGLITLNRHTDSVGEKIALVQTNMDQNNWGSKSIDSCFAITGEMVKKAALDKPDLIVLPESALLCFLAKNQGFSQEVASWSAQTKIPIVVGAIDWNKTAETSAYAYDVYNTAFFVDTGAKPFLPYYKMQLVPFGEELPFEGIFPIISRVNLGEADFKRGKDPTIFSIGNKIKAVPFICYEIIFPHFVRTRVNRGANVMLQITNDGWFGKSSAAYQHAAMARFRCIENGIPLIRCANSGISFVADRYGRVNQKTELFRRSTLIDSIHINPERTLYSRLGDWPVVMSLGIALMAVIIAWGRALQKKSPKG